MYEHHHYERLRSESLHNERQETATNGQCYERQPVRTPAVDWFAASDLRHNKTERKGRQRDRPLSSSEVVQTEVSDGLCTLVGFALCPERGKEYHSEPYR